MSFAAGWYDDGSGRQRYWDGEGWTEQVKDDAAPAPIAPPVARDIAPPVPAGSALGENVTFAEAGPWDAPQARRSRVSVIGASVVGGILVVGIVVTLVALVMTRSSSEPGPREAFDGLVEAWKAKDCPAEYELAAARADFTPSEYCDGYDMSWVDDYGDWHIEVTDVLTVGSTATVSTDETFTDPSTGVAGHESWAYTFVLVDGEWLFSDATITQ